MNASKTRYHLNVRAALILAAIGLTTALGLYVLWGYQEKQILALGLEQVKKFRDDADEADKRDDQDQKSRYNDLALRHLTQYLDARPNDPEGLDIEAKLRFEAKDYLGAASVYEHLIRVEGGARKPRAAGREVLKDQERELALSRVQTARRRLAEIYITISDLRRNSLIAKLMPVQVGLQERYHVAELHAKNLLGLVDEGETKDDDEEGDKKPGEIAPAQSFSEDAKAHLLYAMALEGQIVPGQTSDDRRAFVVVRGEKQGEKQDEGWGVSVEDGAILEYENALELMAKNALELRDEKTRNEHMRDDIVAAMRLAGLYQKASRKTTYIGKKLKKLIIDDPHRPRPEANRPDDAGREPKNSAVDNETFVSFLKAHSAARRLADLYRGSLKNTFDLQLMSPVNDVSGIPTTSDPMQSGGKSLIILAVVNQVLHFRIFDGHGNMVVDTDEKRLTEQPRPIEALRRQLEGLWSPHKVTEDEKVRVINAVTSIVGYPRKNNEIAKEVFDDLLKVYDDSVEVRIARYTFFNSIGDSGKATAELEQAILLDPENLLLTLMAAENAMRSGPVGSFEPHFWLDQVPQSWRDRFDLQLMSSVDDVSGIPKKGGPTRSAGKGLIILAAVNQVLHFRMFDGDGKMVVDTDENRLTEKARQIENEKRPTKKARQIKELRRELESLWPPHELTEDEKVRVINVVTSIVDATPRDDPRVLTVQGMVEYTEQKYESALATWSKGRDANPNDIGLTQRVAQILLELGRDEEAGKIVDQYRRLVDDSKSDPVLQFLEGIQNEHAGRFSRAIESLELARGRLPDNFQTHVHLILARCQEKQGDFVGAAKTYRTALGFDPKSLVLRQLLGRLLLATQPEEAAREFEEGLKSSPNQPALLMSLAEARLRQQKALPQEQRNWSDFKAVFNRATAVLPSSIVLTLLKAEQLAADGVDQAIAVDRAISFLRDEVKKNPKSVELTGRLADYLRSQGRPDEALDVLTQASDVKAAGDRGSLRVQRAMALTSKGEGRKARDLLLSDVNKLAPADRDEVWTFLFLLCRSQSNPETTRATYNEWARLLPDDPRPKFALLEMDIEANNQEAIDDRLKSLTPHKDRLKSLTPHKDQGDFMYRLVQARQRLMEAKKSPAEKDRKDLLKAADTLVESVLTEFKIDAVALLLKGQILEAEGAAEKAGDFYSQSWARGNVDALVRLIDLWTRLGRKLELDRLRQNDKTRQLDMIVATAYLSQGAKSEAARIARQSLAEHPGKPTWQVGILDYLGKNEEAETSLRAPAEQQPGELEPWLALVRFYATQHRAQAPADSDRRHSVEETLEEIAPLLKNRWPDELLAAERRFAAADWPGADKAFEAALTRYPRDPAVQAAEARFRAAQKEDLNEAEACLSRLKAEANIAKFKPLLKAGWPNELLEAECRFAAADWPDAEKAFDAARAHSQLPEVQAAAERYRTQKGRPDAAEACLRRLEAEVTIATEIKPRLQNRWPDGLLAAECRFAAADWPAADKAFEAALKSHPEAPEVQAAATRYQAQKGRPDMAKACLRRLKIEATIAEAKQRVRLPWPELIEAECRRAAADFLAADQAFDAAAKRYRDERDVQLAASRYYEERGRLDDAEACLKRMLKRNPEERGAVRELAIVLSGQGAWKEALELLGPEGNTPEERLARAIVLGRSRDLDRMKEAIKILQALMADLPAENSVAYTVREMLTRCLLAAGQADQASKVAATSARSRITPATTALYAEALLQSRQFDAAEEQRKRLEQMDPDHPVLANLRARLILGRSKRAEAAATLEKAYLDLAKENIVHAEQFGREAFPMILGLGSDAQGVAEELATHLAKQNPALSWTRASILASRGKRAEALALCRTAVEAGRSPADFHEACRVAMEVGVASRSETTTLNQVHEILEAAVQRMSEADDLLVMKAMIAHFQSHFDEESHLYRDVLSRKPQFPLALNNLAWVLSEGLNKPDEALKMIDEVIQLTDRNPNNVDTRGVILMRLGRLEQAIDELKWVVQAEPTGVHYYHLAHVYRKMGRDADFRKAFEEAKRAGLTAEALDPAERTDFEDMLKALRRNVDP